MKPVVYLETSVLSYLASRPNRNMVTAARQAISHDWWENHRHRFALRVSALVEEEAKHGDSSAVGRRADFLIGIPSLAITAEALTLAQSLLAKAAVPKGSEADALHIAIAATQGADYLLTWNFKHINNAEKRDLILMAVESSGYKCPKLCSPEELGADTND